jgi:predicted ribosomally synthesized peptide with SipW-like signal peptide
VVALAILCAAAGLAVFSAFSSSQESSTNTFAAGTVTLASNGTGAVLFDLPNMKPGESATKCVQVTYNGTLNAKVELSGTHSGGLAQYLSTSVTRGSFPGSAPANNSCEGFTPDAENPSLWSGTLNTFPTSSSPISDPGSWSTGSVHVYEITMTLPAEVPNAAQGEEAHAAFSWQAQNS